MSRITTEQVIKAAERAGNEVGLAGEVVVVRNTRASKTEEELAQTVIALTKTIQALSKIARMPCEIAIGCGGKDPCPSCTARQALKLELGATPGGVTA